MFNIIIVDSEIEISCMTREYSQFGFLFPHTHTNLIDFFLLETDYLWSMDKFH
jgi:hypothetical protein